MTNLTIKQQVETLARDHGAELEDNSSGHVDDVTLYLPAGREWNATGCHTLVGHQFTGGKASLWRALLEDMRKGVGECTTTPCDICQRYPVSVSA